MGLYSYADFVLDAGFAWATSLDGLAAFADGAIPFADPLAANGLYDPCDPSFEYSKALGALTRDLELALATRGGSGYRGWLLGRGNGAGIPAGILNSNNWLRLGWSWSGSAGGGRAVVRLASGGKNGVPWLTRHLLEFAPNNSLWAPVAAAAILDALAQLDAGVDCRCR